MFTFDHSVPKIQKWCIYNLNLIYKTSQNTHFYNPVSTVQFSNLALTVQFLHPSTTVQLLQSRFDCPIFTIQSRTSISLNTQGVSEYFFEKNERSILEIFNKNRLCTPPECENQLVSKPSIFTTSNGSYSQMEKLQVQFQTTKQLANIFQGRIKYELIYSLRGAKHREDCSVHIRWDRERYLPALSNGPEEDTFIGICLGVC